MCKRFIFFFFASSVWGSLSLEDLTLERAEEIALEYNKHLLIAQEKTLQAKERSSQALSRYFPALQYRAEFRDISKKELFFDVFSSHFTFSHQGYSSILQLSQPLFSTELIFSLKSKNLESEVYQYRQASTKNELLFALRDRFYAVIFFQKALEIERENIDYLSFALKQEQGKLEAGNSTPFEVNQSKVAVANAISTYYASLKELKNARNALTLTLGIDPLLEPLLRLKPKEKPIESIPELALKLEQINQKYHYRQDTFPTTQDYLSHIDTLEKAETLCFFSPQEVKEYLHLALAQRPDLLAQKLQIGVATQNVNTKLGTYLPKISGYVRYSYNDIDLGTRPFLEQDYHLSAVVVLSWNLFDSMLREHEIREAKSIKSASQISYSQELERIEVEVRNGLYQLEESMLRYSSAHQAVFVAEQAREQAQEKLQFGRIAPLEYRDSVNQLCQARNQENRASFDLLAAYYQIRYATGMDAHFK